MLPRDRSLFPHRGDFLHPRIRLKHERKHTSKATIARCKHSVSHLLKNTSLEKDGRLLLEAASSGLFALCRVCVAILNNFGAVLKHSNCRLSLKNKGLQTIPVPVVDGLIFVEELNLSRNMYVLF